MVGVVSGDTTTPAHTEPASWEGEVVAKVGCRFGQVHRLEGEPGGDALVEGGEDAHAKLAGEGGLADQDAGKGAGLVHVGGGQQVGLVDDEDHAAVAFGLFGGE